MKNPRLYQNLCTLFVAGSIACISFSPTPISGAEQNPSNLDINLFPGIWIDGTVGKSYRVEYSDRMNPLHWTSLTNIPVLKANPTLVFDVEGVSNPQRIYRAVEIDCSDVLKNNPWPSWFYNTEDFPGENLGKRFNNAIKCLPPEGGTIVIPPGHYHTDTELKIPHFVLDGNTARSMGRRGPVVKNISVWAYGAVISTGPDVDSGLKLFDSGEPRSIYGLKVDHRTNKNASFGINITNCSNVRLYDTRILANDVRPGYAAIRVGTNSFWTQIENPWIRKNSRFDVGDIPIGILVEGNANGTKISGGGINNVHVGIMIRPQIGRGLLANAILIEGMSFEFAQTAIKVQGKEANQKTSRILGLRIVNNRFEPRKQGSIILSLTNLSRNVSSGTNQIETSFEPILFGNMYSYSSDGEKIVPGDFPVRDYDEISPEEFSALKKLLNPKAYRKKGKARRQKNK